jgi:hypothetical protein
LKRKKRTRSNQRAPATTAKPKRREIFVYDGRDCIGRFVFDEKAGGAKAFKSDGKAIGKYSSFAEAARAISRTHITAKAKGTGGASAQTSANAASEASRGAPA